MIEPEEAAKLIRAVAHNNAFARGRKNRMEAWKVVFGVYVSARFKHPTYTIAGLRWKLHFTMEYSGNRYKSTKQVMVPIPNIYAKADLRSGSITQAVVLKFESFEGEEDAFKKDFTILRMFESEWKSAPARPD